MEFFNNLSSTDLSGKLKDKMSTAVYDTDNDGIVDAAKLLKRIRPNTLPGGEDKPSNWAALGGIVYTYFNQADILKDQPIKSGWLYSLSDMGWTTQVFIHPANKDLASIWIRSGDAANTSFGDNWGPWFEIDPSVSVAIDGSSVMTGDIVRKAGPYTFKPITVYEGDNNGAAIVMQSGGLMVVGSGESADTVYKKIIAEGKQPYEEQTYVTSDVSIRFITGAQNIGTSKEFIMDTSGDIVLPGTQRGLMGYDSTNYRYPLIRDNGSNLWIGSSAARTKHHTGEVYISSGYTGSKGNNSIKIAVPNDDNTGVKGLYDVIHSSSVNNPDQKISSTLVLTNGKDAAGNADNGPALIVGGERTTRHLELDSNEILGKTNATTLGEIGLNETMALTPNKRAYLYNNTNFGTTQALYNCIIVDSSYNLASAPANVLVFVKE